jgi:hypothetical protein
MTQASSHWDDDKLDRRRDAEFLYNFLVGQVDKRRGQGRPGSYVLNVDSAWGGGKSFFLDGFAEDAANKGHIVVRINAWKDDHAQDPYVAIMAAIDNAFAPYIKKSGHLRTSWEKAKSSGGAIALRVVGAVTKGLIKKHTGVSLDELGDIIATEDGSATKTALDEAGKVVGDQLEKLFDGTLEAMIEGFQTTEKATADFRSKLSTVVSTLSDGQNKPIFILVDELDRCRPSYAVQLLERVKHLFDVDGVVFVFATNSEQLQYSIAGAYGSGFDGFKYLKRFFDRTYVFAEPSIEQLVSNLCANLPSGKIRAPEDKLDEAIWTGCRAVGLDLRAIIQVMEIIENTSTSWPHKTPVDISLLFPVCVDFYLTGKASWPHWERHNLSTWKMKRVRFDFERREIEKSFEMGDIYRIAQERLDKLSKSIRAHRTDGITHEYVADLFLPEWNGVAVDPDSPSVQIDIVPLVANAGRLIAKTV